MPVPIGSHFLGVFPVGESGYAHKSGKSLSLAPPAPGSGLGDNTDRGSPFGWSQGDWDIISPKTIKINQKPIHT